MAQKGSADGALERDVRGDPERAPHGEEDARRTRGSQEAAVSAETVEMSVMSRQ